MDEGAIFGTIQKIPMGANILSLPGGPPVKLPPLACPIFEVLIGDISARAVCYSWANKKTSAVVIIASDEYFGIVLSFYRNNQGATELREKVLTIIPRFKVERGVGDAALMRWMR